MATKKEAASVTDFLGRGWQPGDPIGWSPHTEAQPGSAAPGAGVQTHEHVASLEGVGPWIWGLQNHLAGGHCWTSSPRQPQEVTCETGKGVISPAPESVPTLLARDLGTMASSHARWRRRFSGRGPLNAHSGGAVAGQRTASHPAKRLLVGFPAQAGVLASGDSFSGNGQPSLEVQSAVQAHQPIS